MPQKTTNRSKTRFIVPAALAIIAVVEKAMTNELIRRIERVTGKLDNCSQVMVIVQEAFYAAGSLEV